MVVVVPPELQPAPCVGARFDVFLVEHLVPEPAVEALDDVAKRRARLVSSVPLSETIVLGLP